MRRYRRKTKDVKAGMGSNFFKRCRLFVLGSGFSASAGIPLTKPLLAQAMRLMKKEAEGIHWRINRSAGYLCRAEGWKRDYRSIPFDALSTFLSYQELREEAGGECWSDSGSREMLTFRFYLSKVIAQRTPNAGDVKDPHLSFVRQLHPGDIVLTTNWDCLLENALDQLGRPWSYTGDAYSIRIWKLHGSVHWRLVSAPQASRFRWAKPDRGDDFLPGVEVCDALRTASSWSCVDVLAEVEPFLVLPGWGKAVDVRKIAALWYKIESAPYFTWDAYVIGLGLPADDFFVKGFFVDNFPYQHKSSESRNRHVTIINRSRSACKTLRQYVGSKNVTYRAEGFAKKHVSAMETVLASFGGPHWPRQKS